MKFLSYLGQYLLNWLNLLDHALNTLLLGDPGETISARTARARAAGSQPACYFCAFLTWGQKVVTFGKVRRDHCDYALDRKETTNSREIWSWSQGKILETPESQVKVTEINDQ